MILMQHEAAAEYHGCWKCKKSYYPYYWGNDHHFYCEDCVQELVREKKAKYGRHGITAPGLPRPHQKPSLSNDELRVKYNELIMAVTSKFPGETRHQTALRYIREAETPSGLATEALKEQK